MDFFGNNRRPGQFSGCIVLESAHQRLVVTSKQRHHCSRNMSLIFDGFKGKLLSGLMENIRELAFLINGFMFWKQMETCFGGAL